MYTDEFLLNELKRYYIEHNKSPTSRDFNNNKKFPNYKTYQIYFGTWNNALEIAGLKVNKVKNLTNNEYCEICKSAYTSAWFYRDNKRICRKCYSSDRNYLHGVVDPESTTGIGIITEHVVYEILCDCEKCNTNDDFQAYYDLISEKYGTINVKSSKLLKYPNKNSIRWMLGRHENSKTPDYYICIGFNEDKSEILKVWIIPGNSELVIKSGINITNSTSGLKRAKQYEVDPEPYNKVYQNLDITTLSEFRNLNNTEAHVYGI